MGRLRMSCRELVEGLRAHLDGEGGCYRRALVSLHLLLCSACRAYARSYRHTCRLVAGATSDAEVALPDDLYARLREAAPRPNAASRPRN